ncbi:Predicted ATPase [Hymenobacter daecheongensis DSM 21074]|uniref:Predicted ATPase n=1 Tax=Hymenobacter daecheongensis DSM 21074 TaxID=1121955 RepID=A0A1M6HWL1_9BACT|nr:AAA family ATPase [Hymenobacter daecheongensis]SHJ26619.1 Predicted ATPase [Hymenobacter daecheongensis DSM 21074]
MSTTPAAVPRLTYLRIRNYRALHDLELRDLTPLTVLVGPNGSGKSTVLDALAFLAEAVSGNLQQAWEKRNRFVGMRTRGQEGPIEFEVGVKLSKAGANLRYYCAFDEKGGSVSLVDERLEAFGLDNSNRSEVIFSMIKPVNEKRNAIQIKSSKKHSTQTGEEYFVIEENETNPTVKQPFLSLVRMVKIPYNNQVKGVVDTIRSYRYISLTDNHKGYSDEGPREKLSSSGDNLPNVLYYLHLKHPRVLETIITELRRQIPNLAEVLTEVTSDERLLLRFRDAPFAKPLPAQYMSDGTLRLTALLTLLHEPDAAGLLGLEEPENELHPRLLPRLAEALLQATEKRQLLVATHSPTLLNALEPEQVWILHRAADGYTQATRIADMPDIVAMVEEGSPLGYLWTRNFFEVGDPLDRDSIQPARQ